RPALHFRKDGSIQILRKALAAENETTSWSAQRFMSGTGDELRMRHRRRMLASGDQSGDMRHIDHRECPNLTRDLPDPFEVDRPRIGACSHDDQSWLFAAGNTFKLFIVDGFGFFPHAIRNEVIVLSGKIQRMTVCQVTAVRQRHPQYG